MSEDPSNNDGTVTWTIDEPSGFIRSEASGNMTQEAMLRHFLAMGDGEGLPRPHLELFDARGIERCDVTRPLVHRLIDLMHVREHSAGAKIAVVADRDLIYGMARMMGLVSEGLGGTFAFQAFRSEDEAVAWLRRSDDDTSAE